MADGEVQAQATEQTAPAGVTEAAAAGEQPTARTFTQAEFEEALTKRLERDRTSLLRRAGFASIEEAEAALKQRQAAADAEKSELQKAQERLQAVEREATEAKQQLAVTARNARYQEALAKLGVSEFAKALRLTDFPDGDVDFEALAKAFVKDNPWAVRQSAADTRANAGRNGGAPPDPRGESPEVKSLLALAGFKD